MFLDLYLSQVFIAIKLLSLVSNPGTSKVVGDPVLVCSEKINTIAKQNS